MHLQQQKNNEKNMIDLYHCGSFNRAPFPNSVENLETCPKLLAIEQIRLFWVQLGPCFFFFFFLPLPPFGPNKSGTFTQGFTVPTG